MDFNEALDRAVAEFERRLRLVDDDQWDDPTPCEGWTVRDLVNHVVGANLMSTAMLRGDSREQIMAGFQADYVGDDPVGAFTASVDAQRAAFAEPGAFERTCAHPLGDLPGFQIFGFRVADHLFHAWDLARAIGADERLDEDVVALVYAGMAPAADTYAATGLFGEGPSGGMADDAPLQDRLLDLSGRRP